MDGDQSGSRGAMNPPVNTAVCIPVSSTAPIAELRIPHNGSLGR